ncbi:hypothetical protein J6590_067176 [Homalodisca vitripennis]|nr:hypothetical protein J6590_067176 [Homalodisca vitripennis]
MTVLDTLAMHQARPLSPPSPQANRRLVPTFLVEARPLSALPSSTSLRITYSTRPADDVDDIPQPRVRIRSSTSKTEECERFIPKLMMRGEHVAVVIATDY